MADSENTEGGEIYIVCEIVYPGPCVSCMDPILKEKEAYLFIIKSYKTYRKLKDKS